MDSWRASKSLVQKAFARPSSSRSLCCCPHRKNESAESSAFRSGHREDRALRVEALHDPAASRHLHGAVNDLAARVLDAQCRGADGIGVKIIEPERRRRLRHFRHQPARGPKEMSAFVIPQITKSI